MQAVRYQWDDVDWIYVRKGMTAMAEEKKDSGEKTDEKEPKDGTQQSLSGAGEKKLSETEPPEPSSKAAFEGIYDRLPDISVKAVDRFILLCVIVLVAVVVIGVLRARHVI